MKSLQALLLFLSVVFGAAGVCISPAHACSLSPVWITPAAESLPREGPAVFELYCVIPGYCDRMTTLDVTAGDDVIEGTLERHEAGADRYFLVWTPKAALAADTLYKFTAALGTDLETLDRVSAELTTSDAAEWSPARLELLATSLWAETTATGQRYCCSTSVCSSPCFSNQAVTRAVVSVNFTESATGFPGFVYRLRWLPSQDVEETVSEWALLTPGARLYPQPASPKAIFDDAEAEYCVTVELKGLVDGTVQSEERCYQAAPDVPYAQVTDDALDESELTLCMRPPVVDLSCEISPDPCELSPPVIVEAWCEANRARCEGDADAFSNADCSAWERHCGAQQVDDDNAETSDEAQALAERRDLADSSDAPTDSAADSQPAGDGCALSPQSPSVPVAWLLALCALLLRARRSLMWTGVEARTSRSKRWPRLAFPLPRHG